MKKYFRGSSKCFFEGIRGGRKGGENVFEEFWELMENSPVGVYAQKELS